jgi:hypothetical protein
MVQHCPALKHKGRTSLKMPERRDMQKSNVVHRCFMGIGRLVLVEYLEKLRVWNVIHSIYLTLG